MSHVLDPQGPARFVEWLSLSVFEEVGIGGADITEYREPISQSTVG